MWGRALAQPCACKLRCLVAWPVVHYCSKPSVVFLKPCSRASLQQVLNVRLACLQATLGELKRRACEAVCVKEADVQLWCACMLSCRLAQTAHPGFFVFDVTCTPN